MSPAELFTLIIYQPFFNVLVFFYWVLNLVTDGHGDMGIAVILLTLVIRMLLLPISMMEERSETERRAIAEQIKEYELTLSHDPVARKKAIKSLFKSKPSVIVGELFSLFIQISISLMLWRIFGSGLKGEDVHLIYSFMPQVEIPKTIIFLGQFDLSKSSLFLNFLQSLLIFAFETIAMYTSPYKPEPGEVVRMQLTLPVVSFIIFMGLPAGKKLFVITALCFSIVVVLIKFIIRRFTEYQAKVAEAAQESDQEKVLVEVKE